MIIDANMHWLPEDLFTNIALRDAFLACVPKEEGELAYVAKMPGTDLEQIVIAKPEGHENLNYAENQYDPALRVKDMDGAGVDLAVLRIPVFQSWLPLDLCKQVNDLLAAHVADYPDRVRALAVAPPDGTPECLAEVERALALPGFVGVQMAAHYGTDYLDAPRFRGYFSALERSRRARGRAPHAAAGRLGQRRHLHQHAPPVRALRRPGHGRRPRAVQRPLRGVPQPAARALDARRRLLRLRQHAGAAQPEVATRSSSASTPPRACASASRPTSTSTPPAPPSGARTSSSAPSRCSAPTTSSTAARIPSGASGSPRASSSCKDLDIPQESKDLILAGNAKRLFELGD